MTARHRRPAFTLLELLVVIAIIAVLLGLLLPAVQQVRAAAARANCQNNLKQLGLGLHHYHDVNGQFPPAHSQDPFQIPDYRNRPGPPDGYFYFSWLARILPYVEQGSLYDRIRWDQPAWWNPGPPVPGDIPVNGVAVKLYRCPSDPVPATIIATGYPDPLSERQTALTSYLGVNGTDQFRFDGILYVNARVKLDDVTDGTSQTLLVGERPPAFGGVAGWWFAGSGMYPWFGAVDIVLGSNERIGNPVTFAGAPNSPQSSYRPGKLGDPNDWADPHAWHFWSFHSGGSNFLLADGSVRFITYGVGRDLVGKLATRNGGEVVNGEY